MKAVHIRQQMDRFLEASTRMHKHLCPRQVLGVRMGMFASSLLQIALPQADKRLLTIVETDGCFADGISVATGCWMGRRTMRMEDYGKIAATFVDTHLGYAFRIAPGQDIRIIAGEYTTGGMDSWHTQLVGYQKMPSENLFTWQEVELVTPIAKMIGVPGVRTICERCGEEIINQREVSLNGFIYCRACTGQVYYSSVSGQTCRLEHQIITEERIGQ